MADLKKIMYGVTDFPLMRRENAYLGGHGPYLVRHELEANGGFTDIAFHPQLDRYAADHDLATLWRLRPLGTVKLTRLLVVFHGANLALCDEVR